MPAHRVQMRLTPNQAETAACALDAWLAAHPNDAAAEAALRKIDAALDRRDRDRA